jgi:hypothetical protein
VYTNIMNTNVGSTDQIVRLLVGILALGLFFGLEGNGRWLGLIGGVLIGTAAFRWCPIYRLLGMSTESKLPQDYKPV